MNAPTYPIHLHLAGRPVLVVGAGRVATRKIERLLVSGAEVAVVATEAAARVAELAHAGHLTLALRAFQPEDVHGKCLVIAATDDAALNAQIVQLGRAQGALVTRVDDAAYSDFSIPAVARASTVEVTVSTHGAAPSASRRLARELTAWLAQGPDRFAAELARVRSSLRGQAKMPGVLKRLAEGELLAACTAQDEARIAAIVAAAQSQTPARSTPPEAQQATPQPPSALREEQS